MVWHNAVCAGSLCYTSRQRGLGEAAGFVDVCYGGGEGGESVAVRLWIRWCGTRWRLGVYSGASRGEVAEAARIEDRNGGRAESRVDFGLISISAEPVREARGRRAR